MKKNLFMLGAAIVALSSCTQDEVLNVNENRVISFESYVNKSTRAVTETTTAGLQKFFVYGYYGTTTVFDGIPVTKVDANWKYNGGTHTPWTGANYYFGAYASTNNAAAPLANVTFETGKLSIAGYEVKDAEDLVVAYKNVDNTGLTNPTVDLDFKHALSQVYFELTNASTENLTMTISNISVGVKKVGDCEYNGTAITWKNHNTDQVLAFDGAAGIAKASKHATGKHLAIPGQATASIYASFTVTFYNSSSQLIDTKTYNNVALTVADDWKPGYVYKYTASVSPTMPTIEFSASVSTWTDAEQGF